MPVLGTRSPFVRHVPSLWQVSLVLVKKNLFLFSLTDPDNPVELAFQARYGNITQYEW